MGGFGGGTCVFGVGPFLMPAGVAGTVPGERVTPFAVGTGGCTPATAGVVVVVVDAVPAAVRGSRGASVGVTFWLAATLASRSFSLRSNS